MKPLRLSVYSYFTHFVNDYLLWFDERINGRYTFMLANANVIKLYKMKEISIFHQYLGTIDAFIYKAYYIDFKS